MNAIVDSGKNPRGILKSVIVLNDHGWINGGQAKVAIESALYLKRIGLDVCFIAGAGPADDRLMQAGVECHVAGEHDILSHPNRIQAATLGMWNSSAATLLAKCVSSREPRSTVIHVHGWAKALSPSIGPIITKSDAAHVITLHEYFLACPTGGFFHHGSKQICTRRPLGLSCLASRCDPRNDLHKAWRVARHVVLKTAGGLPRGLREIIYLAPEQKRIMEPYFSRKARWHYLPNPVESRPSERLPSERNKLFLFVGRLSPEKGAEVAAAAAKIAGVTIAFCGDGENREAVRQANPDALLLGWLDQSEVDNWMRKARCVVFPSLWYECNPLVVAEALALGVPIIVSDTCVAASSVEDGVHGLHARTGDISAWADAMTLLQTDELVESLGKAAFKAGRQLLLADEYTTQLTGIYAQAIQRRQKTIRRPSAVDASC